MLIFENGTYQTNSLYPDVDFIPEDTRRHWVIPDNSELAQRIIAAYSFVPITDDAGELVDIQIPKSTGQSQSIQPPTIEEQITEMQLAICELYEKLVGGIK